MEDAACCLERRQDLSKPKVTEDGYDHDSHHDQARVPPLWHIVLIVEDCHGCEHVR